MAIPQNFDPSEDLDTIQQQEVDTREYAEYVAGKFPLPDTSLEIQRDYRRLVEDGKLNVTRLVVQVIAERLKAQGFIRPGGTGADEELSRVWRRARMHLLHREAHWHALARGSSYVWLWPNGRAAVETPAAVTVHVSPEDGWSRVYAARAWKLGGQQKLTVADEQEYRVYAQVRDRSTARTRWVAEKRTIHRYGAPPVVPYVNSPQDGPGGRSEVEDVMPIQRRIDQMVYLLCLAGEISAVTQKWIANLELPVNEETGETESPLQSKMDSVWLLEGAETGQKAIQAGEFSAAQLSNFTQAVESMLAWAALLKRFPRHSMVPSGQAPSGDALRTSEAGLVSVVEERSDWWDLSHCEVVTLLARRAGLDLGDLQAEDLAVDWAEPEVYTLGEITDSAVKKVSSLNVPYGQAYEDLGYTPEQQARWQAMRIREATESIAMRQALGLPEPSADPEPAEGEE